MKGPLKQITKDQRQGIATRFHMCGNLEDFYGLLHELVNLLGISTHAKKYCHDILKPFELGNGLISYSSFSIRKRSRKLRQINAPTEELKLVQRLNNFLFSCVFEGHNASHGFKKGSSVVSNARNHVAKEFLLNIDLKNFFPSINIHKVKAALRRPPFNLSGERVKIADHLSLICTMDLLAENDTKDHKKDRVLPQGAPTSPLLSNAVCQDLDNLLETLANENDLNYSRYADDITFSSNHNVFFEGSDFLLGLNEIICEQGFVINPGKTRLLGKSVRQEVTGITVNKKTNVRRTYVKAIRMYLHYWEKYGYIKAEAYFVSDRNFLSGKDNVATLFSTLDGRLNYMKMVVGSEDPTYIKLSKRFKKLARKKTSNKKSEILAKADFTEHRPYDVARFLRLFQDSDGLKYLTHDYDLIELDFDYDRIMMYATLDFYRAFNDYSITKPLYAKVIQFAFDENPKWWRYENGKKIEISIGWSSKQIKDWVTLNPGSHPIRSKYLRDNLINPFKESIQFRPPKLQDKIKKALEEKFGEDYNNLSLTYSGLEIAEFYTDVETILNGIRHLLDGILDRIDASNKIFIGFRKETVNNHSMKILEITHIGSKCYKNAQPSELLNGNFQDAVKLFRGLCNWSIRAPFADGYHEIEMLTDGLSTIGKKELGEVTVKGFTHLLFFY